MLRNLRMFRIRSGNSCFNITYAFEIVHEKVNNTVLIYTQTHDGKDLRVSATELGLKTPQHPKSLSNKSNLQLLQFSERRQPFFMLANGRIEKQIGADIGRQRNKCIATSTDRETGRRNTFEISHRCSFQRYMTPYTDGNVMQGTVM